MAPLKNFWGKSFSIKSGCHIQLHKGFNHHAEKQRNLMRSNSKKIPGAMIQHGRMERHYFTGPFQLPP